MTDRRGPGGQEEEPVVVRDRRRIDPLTGQVRTPEGSPTGSGAAPAQPDTAGSSTAGSGAAASAEQGTEGEIGVDAHDAPLDPADDKLAQLSAQLDERTADLQRVSAEYANYRRRTDRDREAVAVAARGQIAGELLTVLDDIARAEAHGDLTGAFKSVADKLVGTLTRAGLAPFGVEGEPFDPSVHEAVQHTTSPEVSGPTVSLVMRQGYRIGDRVLRPAMVAVVDAEPGAGPAGGPDLAGGPEAETVEGMQPAAENPGETHEHD